MTEGTTARGLSHKLLTYTIRALEVNLVREQTVSKCKSASKKHTQSDMVETRKTEKIATSWAHESERVFNPAAISAALQPRRQQSFPNSKYFRNAEGWHLQH